MRPRVPVQSPGPASLVTVIRNSIVPASAMALSSAA